MLVAGVCSLGWQAAFLKNHTMETSEGYLEAIFYHHSFSQLNNHFIRISQDRGNMDFIHTLQHFNDSLFTKMSCILSCGRTLTHLRGHYTLLCILSDKNSSHFIHILWWPTGVNKPRMAKSKNCSFVIGLL